MTTRNASTGIPEAKSGQRASIEAVARRAGVSIATVSRVVNGVAKKASPETIARVREAIAALDYRPSGAGRSLRHGSSRLVAVLAANLANPAMAAIAASAETALRERGLIMVLCDTHDRPELQDEYLKEMGAQQARAIVLLGAVDSPVLRNPRAEGETVIFVNRRDPTGAAGRFIGIDNRQAGEEVAGWAMARGYRASAVVHGSLRSSATRDRVEGILDAFERSGKPLAAQMRVASDALDHLSIGREAAARIIGGEERPDCAICLSDLIAFGFRRHWREALPGVAAPRLIGFDDNPLNEWVAPELSSVRIPYEAFGPAIVAAILEPEAGATLLPYRLVERGRG